MMVKRMTMLAAVMAAVCMLAACANVLGRPAALTRMTVTMDDQHTSGSLESSFAANSTLTGTREQTAPGVYKTTVTATYSGDALNHGITVGDRLGGMAIGGGSAAVLTAGNPVVTGVGAAAGAIAPDLINSSSKAAQ